MRASITVLAALIASAVAYPSYKRQNGTTAALATSYTITGFQFFTPAASTPGNNSISFIIGDNLDNVSGECADVSTIAANKLVGVLRSCENPDFNFAWDGTSLTIVEAYAVSGSTLQATGIVEPSVFCIPEGEEFPLGPGTLCESYTGQIGGIFKDSTTS